MSPIRYEGHDTMGNPEQPRDDQAAAADERAAARDAARERQANREGEYAVQPQQYEAMTEEKVSPGDEVKGHLAPGETPETMEYGVTDSPGTPEQEGAREMPPPEEASGIPASQAQESPAAANPASEEPQA